MSELRFLLDTNVLSEPARPIPDPLVLQRIGRHRARIATAAPAFHELCFGVLLLPSGARRTKLELYLRRVEAWVTVLPYDDQAARWHASERARLRAAGKTPAFVDGQIAAIAAANGLTLVTANTGDFADFAGLRIADWRSR